MFSTVLAVVSPVLLSGLMLWYSSYHWRRKGKNNPSHHSPNARVLFFPDLATAQSLSSSSAEDKGSLCELMSALQGAKKSLDVCVFTMSCRELGDVLINAHSSGVMVRIITDNEQSMVSGSQIERLRKKGIQVRTDKSAYFMHHKFALVDEKVLINGSLNWTLQGVCGNQENVVIETNSEIVLPFSVHFEKLWEMYDPEKVCWT
jgi:cardiolipin hydrolase